MSIVSVRGLKESARVIGEGDLVREALKVQSFQIELLETDTNSYEVVANVRFQPYEDNPEPISSVLLKNFWDVSSLPSRRVLRKQKAEDYFNLIRDKQMRGMLILHVYSDGKLRIEDKETGGFLP